MRKIVSTLLLIAMGWALAGCGGSEQPRKDEAGKTAKPPDVLPPGGP